MANLLMPTMHVSATACLASALIAAHYLALPAACDVQIEIVGRDGQRFIEIVVALD